MKHHLPAVLALLIGIIACSRSGVDQAGATDFPNALQGCITTNNQTLANARIRLFRSPITSSTATPLDSALSNARGQYEIHYPEAGLYALEARSANNQHIAWLDSLKLPGTDTALPTLPLQPVVIFSGTLPASLAALSSTLWIEGTPWSTALLADGSYQIAITSQGTYPLTAIAAETSGTPGKIWQIGQLSSATATSNIAMWQNIAPDTTLVLVDSMQLPKALLLPRSTTITWTATGNNTGCSDSLYAALTDQWTLHTADTLIAGITTSCLCAKVSPGIPSCTFTLPAGHQLNGKVTLKHQSTTSQSTDSTMNFHIISTEE